MAEWVTRWFGLNFLTPTYFIFWFLAAAIFILLALALFLKLYFRPRRSKHSRYRLFGPDLVWLPFWLLSILIIIALAGPEGNRGYTISSGGQIDIIFAVDNSFSMVAKDVQPSRLELAKKEILGFLDSPLWQKGDRFTLFLFAKNSNWRMPLSEDVDELRAELFELTPPEKYFEESRLTTDLSAVLEHIPIGMDKADNFYKFARHLGLQDSFRRRIVFLFTDGDDQIKNSLDKGLRELKKRNIKVYPVGVGTRAGRTVRIKVSNPAQYNYDDESGAQNTFRPAFEEEITIRTVLQTQNLTKIAGFTGGEMFVLDSNQNYLRNFLANAVNANRIASLGLSYSTESKNIWWEVLAVPALILLFLAVLLI